MDLLNIDSRLLAIEQALVATKRSLTFEEACRYTGFSQSYMYKLTSAGVVPYSKPNGKTIFFDREKLDEWLLSNSTTSAGEKEMLAATYLTTKKSSR